VKAAGGGFLWPEEDIVVQPNIALEKGRTAGATAGGGSRGGDEVGGCGCCEGGGGLVLLQSCLREGVTDILGLFGKMDRKEGPNLRIDCCLEANFLFAR